jgi:assimilatory nitrate reductase catalytic subunit
VAAGEVRSTCCYCGVGCGVIIETTDETITGVRGDPAHPANHGRLCSKGATLHLTARPALGELRAQWPEMRTRRELARTRVTWDEALEAAAERFTDIIRRHGPDAIGFYISGQLLTEDYYVFNKLAKGLIGTNNIDSNSRLCMSSAVAGYKQTLGMDAPPCAYDDIEHTHCLLIAGSNTAVAHPIVYRRIEAAREARPDLRLIVIDPRRTETAAEADLHLAILPGSDVALFNSMLHVMVWDGLVDADYIRAHTEDFELVKTSVREFTPQTVAVTCGIRAEDIVTAATWFARSPASLSLYCQGLNQSTSGTAKNVALINLHLATGQIGRAGAGPFSLTGQPKAMGGREVCGMANLLSAHRDLGNAEHRVEVAALWGVPTVPAKAGKTAVEMFAGLGDGTIKAVWIVCTNPAQSMPDLHEIHAALRQAEFVVVQEAYRDTETTAFADVLLPAASWGEKEGTVTNSERRISRVRAAVTPPGESRADWAIAVDFARRLEARLAPARSTLFPYETPEAIWREHRDSTRGRDLDITGLSYDLLNTAGPQQWPYPVGASTGTPRLYTDGRFPTASGRAKCVVTPYRPTAEVTDARYPLSLTTARLRDHWHGMSRTGTLAQLFAHTPEPAVAVHPHDLLHYRLSAGELVALETRRGRVYALVSADDTVRPGQVALPMHWGSRFLGGRDSLGVNTLTSPAFDPSSKQPELKHAAARLAKAELPWRLVAFGIPSRGTAASLLAALVPWRTHFPFFSAVLIGRSEEGVLLRVADHIAPPNPLTEIDQAFGLLDPAVLCYDDRTLGISRRARIVDGRLHAIRLTGGSAQLANEAWLKEWLIAGEPVAAIRRFLLASTASAPAGFIGSGRIVCSCENVSETAIRAELARTPGNHDIRLHHVKQVLRCGTNCGSCLPEVRKLVQSFDIAVTA